jgi:hypothetical protein
MEGEGKDMVSRFKEIGAVWYVLVHEPPMHAWLVAMMHTSDQVSRVHRPFDHAFMLTS